MTDQERTQLCKEFTIFTGGHWHDLKHLSGHEYVCGCGSAFAVYDPRCVDMTIAQHNSKNPTYTNPADVLRVILDKQGVGELETFLYCIGYFSQEDNSGADWVIKYIIEPDALLKAAVKWLKEKQR